MSLNFVDYKEQLANLCNRYNVARLELFGSASRDDFDAEKSDLDFLIEFRDTSLPGAFDRYFDFKEALEQLFGKSVDLVEDKAIKNPYFRQSIERDKVLLYGSENQKTAI